MKWWLFSDYDGTLRNGFDGGVDPKDLAFVHDFIQQGNQFILASGRPYEQMAHEAAVLNLQPAFYLTNAGSIIRDRSGKLLYQRLLPRMEQNLVIDYLKTMNLTSLIYATPQEEYYLFTDHPSYYEDGQLKRKITNLTLDDLKELDLVCFKVTEDRKTMNELIAFLKANVPSLTIIDNNDRDLVEIHPPASSKGHAIKVLQAMFELSDEQILVVGDDHNDQSMLTLFPNSFVINQPYNEEIQQFGRYQIDHLFEIGNFLKK